MTVFKYKRLLHILSGLYSSIDLIAVIDIVNICQNLDLILYSNYLTEFDWLLLKLYLYLTDKYQKSMHSIKHSKESNYHVYTYLYLILVVNSFNLKFLF